MDYPHVHPSLERLWRDEVLYLHSLWHQSSSSSPNPNPSITPNTRSRPRANVGPSTAATAFKKTKQNQKKKKKKKKNREPIPDGDPQPSEIEWPCPPPKNQNPGPTGWPDLAPLPYTAPPPSAEEQARLAASAAQRNGLRASHQFFSKEGSSSDEDEDEDEDDEPTCFDFFVRLFEKDAELRVYYEKNAEKGEFSCLVCRGIGEKQGRKFNDCVALVQHSNAISKTKRRGAHRGFGRAVCWVLGWDINRLPTIVLDLGEPLGLPTIVLDLGEPLGPSLATDATPQKDSAAGTKGDLHDKTELVGTNNGELMEYTEETNNKDVLNKEVAKGELLDEVLLHVEAQQENECTETRELRDIPADLSSEDDDESEDGSDV